MIPRGGQKTYQCKACGVKFHSIEEIKKHAKQDHNMEITDGEAKMMEVHELDGHDHD